MSPRGVDVRGSAVGGSGLVALFFVLAGFVAMHGIVATTASGAHHSAALLVTMAAPMTADATASETHPAVPMAAPGGPAEHDGSDGTHGLMAGCLVALFAVLAGVVLRWRRLTRATPAATSLSSSGRVTGPPERPPPRPDRISLCVLRV